MPHSRNPHVETMVDFDQLDLRDGIYYDRLERRSDDEEFLAFYTALRHREGRGSEQKDYYFSLPFVESGPFVDQWRVRANSMEWLLSRLGTRRPLRIADVGAGNCWLTRRLSERGDIVVAVDISDDRLDGLGAGRHFLETGIGFERICMPMEQLPFRAGSLDLIVLNASLHYTADRFRLLHDYAGLLRNGGEIVVLDSPVYHEAAAGRQMMSDRGGHQRSSFLTRAEIASWHQETPFDVTVEERRLPLRERSRSGLFRLRHRREVASMPRICLTMPHESV